MKYLSLVLVALLVACSTGIPVKQKFPDAPKSLVEKCEQLKKIEGDRVAITEMLKVIVQNYGMYYECSAKVDGWNEWYVEQKKIYESVK
jgi:3-deoxy-D-manno-octulosonate 8-phosphate phosphatase KdsC-like HAD superfamily phosphatase